MPTDIATDEFDVPQHRMRPFGEAACEAEVKRFGAKYEQYYFDHTEFSDAAMKPEVFLIIGRRGSGKTALGQYFCFQQRLRNAHAIDVDEPSVYQDVLSRLASMAAPAREVAIPRLARIWEFVIWSVIFHELRERDRRIKQACLFEETGTVAHLVATIIKGVIAMFTRSDKDVVLTSDVEKFLARAGVADAKEAVFEIAKRQPIIIAFDTLENYNIHDEAMIRAMTALIQCAASFNADYSTRNIHLKLFVMAEVFPYIAEEAIGNTLKHVRDEVYLHWRPKDLMRLISWRLHAYLKRARIKPPAGDVQDWEDHEEVKAKMWSPFFGDTINNGRGLSESTFPYVLRHTQLRPRQLIVLCNEIARQAINARTFPNIDAEHIRQGVLRGERDLAKEVLNSYSAVYPNIGLIVEALSGINALFRGNELDRRAPQTASAWLVNEYTPLRFAQLVAELGIVGLVRNKNLEAGYVEADFEYSREDRLPLRTDSECVIHPMFFRKLDVLVDPPVRVYPFPNRPDFQAVRRT